MTARSIDARLLDLVFGAGEGATPEARARASSRRFVRGLDELTFDESPRAKGRRLTATEALEAYGFDKLAEVATEGSALISESVDAAGRALRERREQLGLRINNVASEARLSPDVINALETSRRRPVREYERVARVLGLDERMLSFQTSPSGNHGVAVRLRDLRERTPSLTGSVVIALAEAAWVAMTQIRLEASLSLPAPAYTFQQDPFYGTHRYPAHKVGYDLAEAFRAKLGIGEEPLRSMRDLLERDLRIPVIQAGLGNWIAGATVDSDGRRAIVVNMTGRNQSAFARRATLAHEMCHLLFDPQQSLRCLRVDEYEDLDRRVDQVTDPVEQRANAFAVQLLAPQAAALRLYDEGDADPLGCVMEQFGISFTAARYQIWNGLRHAVPIESIRAARSSPEPHWEASEGYTITYHPIRSLADHPSRAGRFSAVVLRGVEEGIISWDTGAEWLFCSEEELRQAAPAVHELYPDLFQKA